MGGPGGGHPGGRPGFRGVDEAAQRRQNADAPRIAHLGRRVVALFRPYTGRLVVTGTLVVIGAAIAVVPPLIVQHIFDDALFPTDGGAPDLPLLAQLVAATIGLYLLSAAVGVVQTWLTSTVGNRVTGDLRVRLFEHLQAMELAFFTRTKTGVIQSRLQNDVGAVSGVLTNTLTIGGSPSSPSRSCPCWCSSSAAWARCAHGSRDRRRSRCRSSPRSRRRR